MPKDYIPKTDHLTPARLKKSCHDLLKAAKEDRAIAKEAYLFFKGIVDGSVTSDEATDLDARKSMIECMKLMQSAQNTAIRGLDTFIKAEDKLTASRNNTNMAKEDSSPPTWNELKNLDLK